MTSFRSLLLLVSVMHGRSWTVTGRTNLCWTSWRNRACEVRKSRYFFVIVGRRQRYVVVSRKKLHRHERFLVCFCFSRLACSHFCGSGTKQRQTIRRFFGVVHALCPSVSLAEVINIDFVRWRCQEGFQTFFVSSRVVAQMHDLQIVAVSSSKLQGEALLQSMLRACCGEGFMNRSCSVIPCQRKESFSLPQHFFL